MAQHIVRQIHTLLLKRKLTIAVAESCTGGLASKMLTDLAGSSLYFNLGAITYSNSSKTRILRIPASLIRKEGAVSKQVAQKMACNIRRLAASSIGIGITGIAGPSGATIKKPVGTVFICACSSAQCICKKFSFTGNRQAIRKKSALAALRLACRICA